ncbi:MAG TPA: hypothetical protein PKA41_03180 [Verrucomicrobiota bacterium]|nr:hypothetical protein [Verrucomicrobiota bacterium]
MEENLVNQHTRVGSNANEHSGFWSGLDGMVELVVNACVDLFSHLLLAAIDS